MSKDTNYGLHIVGSNGDSDHSDALIDIVAVHGLLGEPFRTWTVRSGQETTFWLRDLLPKHIPDARIMTFGYNAVFSGSTSIAGIRDNSKKLLADLVDKREDGAEDRPLIFIGHSLGGIIIKQALRFARNEKRYEIIANATCGIMFFATPHRGASLEFWEKITLNIAGTCKEGWQSDDKKHDLAKQMKENSKNLIDISEDFRSMADEFSIVSFYEVDKVEWLDSVVVEKSSALMEITHEEGLCLSGTHMDICRFRNEDERFETVWRRLRRLAKDSPKGKRLYDRERLCLQSLCEAAFHNYYKYDLPPRTPNTCTWILERDEYKGWIAEGPRLLWITGGPGCGKTLLSSFLVEQLGSLEQLPRKPIVTSFFCHSRRPERKVAVWFLRALLHQILRHNTSAVRKYALPAYDGLSGKKAIWTRNALVDLLLEVVPYSGLIYLVIDALDECDDGQQDLILQTIKPLLDNRRVNIRICLTSRSHRKLLDELHGYPQVDIKPQDVIYDIKATVKSEVDRIGSQRHLSHELQQRIYEDISKGSDGMFLWASLMVRELKLAKASENSILERLRNLPRGILELYDLILEGISDQNYVRKIISWILGAIRPLKLSELNEAFAIGEGAVSWKSIAPNLSHDIEGDLTRACGQLIRVSNGTIELIHQSLEPFLVSDLETLRASDRAAKLVNQPKFRVILADAHKYISETCITYLLLDEFGDAMLYIKEGSKSESSIRKYLEKYTFIAYASQYWMQHWRLLTDKSDAIKIMIQQLTNAGSLKLDTWVAVHWYLEHPMETPPQNLTPLHLASYLHMPFLLDTNPSNKRLVSSRDSHQRTPLDWAYQYGRDGEVEKLQLYLTEALKRTLAEIEAKFSRASGQLHLPVIQHSTVEQTVGEVCMSTEQYSQETTATMKVTLERLQRQRLLMTSQLDELDSRVAFY